MPAVCYGITLLAALCGLFRRREIYWNLFQETAYKGSLCSEMCVHSTFYKERYKDTNFEVVAQYVFGFCMIQRSDKNRTLIILYQVFI